MTGNAFIDNLTRTTMQPRTPFKRCPCCFDLWPTRDRFLDDPDVELNGYKADFEQLEYGLFFFIHLKLDCWSTMLTRWGCWGKADGEPPNISGWRMKLI